MHYQRALSHFTTFSDHTLQLGLVGTSCRNVLYLAHNKQPLSKNSAEDNMFAIEPVRLCTGDEELAAICVGATVCLRTDAA